MRFLTMSMHDFIVDALTRELAPIHLSVDNDSHLHRSSGPDAESHFKVVVVSAAFEQQRLLQRHQRVNNILAAAFQQGLHALALHTYTPSEWAARQQTIPASTPCQGKH